MAKVISIGRQDFASLIEKNCFFVDKSYLISQWWESEDDITLITRPRRFGKTLNMSMLNCFFSNQYENRGDLFQNLQIWKNEKYRTIQGTYPVISLTFADVKGMNYEDARNGIIAAISDAFSVYRELLDNEHVSESERGLLCELEAYANNTDQEKKISNDTVCRSIKVLSAMLHRCYGKKVIILLDEYDTPMQEAYLQGYWDELAGFIRSLFNSSFKTNTHLERAIMTGITRISKESVFSDLNNLRVVTTTTNLYEDCFGFTEEEVFSALEEYGLGSQKKEVKRWYDGFVFGRKRDIYNPWSITNYLKEGELNPYWTATSSNGLVNDLIQKSTAEMKEKMEKLLNDEEVVEHFDEQIVFQQLKREENAVWSLLVASGYLRVIKVDYLGEERMSMYHLKMTNMETKGMFRKMFRSWFDASEANYNEFMKYLLTDDLDGMNHYMNRITMATFSYFDVGNGADETGDPERFYHGFVLGMMADQSNRYEIRSNRESGFGRYDVMMIPKGGKDSEIPAIIIEFKVRNRSREKSLEETAHTALQQIQEKKYDAELYSRGIAQEAIRHYGFAFEGKRVLIKKQI